MTKFIRRYKYKLIFIIFAAFSLTVIFALFSVDNNTNSSNIEYIKSYGWEVESSPAEISHIRLPEEFNTLYKTYSDLSTTSDSSLYDYCGKNVTRYSYAIKNHAESENVVRANIYVYKSKIIAADISVLKQNGVTAPLYDTSCKK